MDMDRLEAIGQYREVEDAVVALDSPLLVSFRQQLLDVLKVNHGDVIDPAGDDE